MLTQRISTGELGAGALLSETKVAAMLNISRAPARRALGELEAQGLVHKAVGRGYIVSQTRPDDHRDTAPTSPVAARPSWQRIYEEVETELAARIAFGTWRIVETDLARHYGVSRTVARDVLGRLQQRGIVDKDERSRWVAPSLTPERVTELYEVRAILEPAALRRAAHHAPAATLQRMLEELDRALDDPGAVSGALLDHLEHDLHVSFLSFCANRTLMGAIRSPQSLLVAHRFLYRWSPRLFAVEPFLPEHRAIVECLLRADVEGAAERMRQHLLASSERASARVAEVNRTGSCEASPFLHLVGEGGK